jgi:signal peptidase I
MEQTMSKKQTGSIAELVQTLVYAVVIALTIRTLAYEPFNIPSGSMMPTLLVGDYLFVSKYPYGYSRYSLPLGLPLFSGRIFEHPVKRGDIVVFKLPRDNKTDYIKRIVGLPGDRIQMIDGVLHINGKAVKREQVEDFVWRDRNGNVKRARQFRETFPNGASFLTLDLDPHGMVDNTGVFVVPKEHYFAMGDNRDNSQDSRVSYGGVGFIPAENLVGRGEVIFFSTDGSAHLWQVWRWFQSMRFGRFFTSLRAGSK